MSDDKMDYWKKVNASYAQRYSDSLSRQALNPDWVPMLTPKEIVADLDRTVIGQTKAKQLLAIAAHNRLLALRNIECGMTDDNHFFEKNNVILIGGTGCGKTHLIKALAASLGLPVTIQDASSFTSNGYVGRDVGECVAELGDLAGDIVERDYADYNLMPAQRDSLTNRLAEFGIVYIDEADKMRAAETQGKDVNGRSVQESFLKMVEGHNCTLASKRGARSQINTENMLFIFGGAFSGLEEIIGRRTAKVEIGFHGTTKSKDEVSDIMEQVQTKDFTDYGIIPELMGRLPTVAVLKEMDKNTMNRIFSEPDRSIMSQVINEFKSFGVEAAFTEDAIDMITDKALELKIGARGLKATCQQMLRPLFFHLPSMKKIDSIVITKKMLEDVEEF